MPFRSLIAKEYGDMLKAVAHPHRLQIIEEIGTGALDVHTLHEKLGVSQSGVSQHLAVLRAHRLVVERREGRSVFYRLRHVGMAAWLLDGLRFLMDESTSTEQLRIAAERARAVWQLNSQLPRAPRIARPKAITKAGKGAVIPKTTTSAKR